MGKKVVKGQREIEPPIYRRARLPSELEIAEILRAARAAGMSYGEYVSRCEARKPARQAKRK